MDKDIYFYVAGDANYKINIMQKHIRIIGHSAAVRHRLFTSIMLLLAGYTIVRGQSLSALFMNTTRKPKSLNFILTSQRQVRHLDHKLWGILALPGTTFHSLRNHLWSAVFSETTMTTAEFNFSVQRYMENRFK